jgi:hypothetical protein
VVVKILAVVQFFTKKVSKPMVMPFARKWRLIYPNGTACFKKCKQLFEYQHLLLLRDVFD